MFVHKMDWDDKKLVPVAYYEGQSYITTTASLKNYVVFGDIMKSVWLLRWKVSLSDSLYPLKMTLNRRRSHKKKE